MGYAIAENLAQRGAKVFLVSGPTALSVTHPQIERIDVTSAREMYEAALAHFPQCDGAVMSAAVADYTPVIVETQKVKRSKENYFVELTPNPDIAATLGQQKRDNQLLVGFALETNNEEANASLKLKKKNLDFIVLNSLRDQGAGFQHDTNRITILDKNKEQQGYALKSKIAVADDIVEKIVAMLPQ